MIVCQWYMEIRWLFLEKSLIPQNTPLLFPFHRHLRVTRHQISTRPLETAPLPNGTAGRGLTALVAESDTNAFSCFILFRRIFRHFVPLFWAVVIDCCSCPITQIDFKVLTRPDTRCFMRLTFSGMVNTLPQILFLKNQQKQRVIRLIIVFLPITIGRYAVWERYNLFRQCNSILQKIIHSIPLICWPISLK